MLLAAHELTAADHDLSDEHVFTHNVTSCITDAEVITNHDQVDLELCAKPRHYLGSQLHTDI